MLKRLIQFLKNAGAKRESDTKRNGFMSYAAETHAIGHGLYHGLTSKSPTATELPDNKDVQAEPHYFKGAYVVGTLLQVVILLLVGNQLGLAGLL